MTCLLEIASTEDSRCEVAGTMVVSILRMMHISKVMLTFHRLKVVASPKESLYLWVIIIVVHGLDLLWVGPFVLHVMELVRKPSMGSMQLNRGLLGLLNRLA